MKYGSRPGQVQAFVELHCLCGKIHTFLRHQVLDDLGVGRWKCGPCKRRFVIACTPGANGQPDVFWPLFLEQVPSTGDTRQEGLSTDGATPVEAPPELHFQCRCGCRLVGKASMYGHPTRCPKCNARLILRVGFESEDGKPVPLLEYPEGGVIGQAGAGPS